MQTVSFPAGHVIFASGEACEHAYIIHQGSVEVTRDGADDAVEYTGVLGPGALFGEIGLLQNGTRHETARVLEEVKLEVISKAELSALYAQCPPDAQKLISALSSKILDLKRSAGNAQQSAAADSSTSGAAPAEQHSQSGAATGVDAFGASMERVFALMDERCDFLERKIRRLAGEEGLEGVTDNLTQEGVQTTLQELGPLQSLIDDETVNDILVNSSSNVYVERHGKLELTGIEFSDNNAVLDVANDIVRQVGRQLNPNRPLVDARLLDGSRVNIIAPPLAVDGPSISIRKFSRSKITLDAMAESNNVSQSLAEFLKILGKCRMNILISGGTGSGKTTMLNAISNFIGFDERIVTIEDAAELQLQQPHVVRLETKPLSSRGRPEDEVTMRDLVKNALRMRPDRIIVGEVRGYEAFDMMQAMNTGHEGSMGTIHANHPRDALARLENMISMANLNIPSKSIKEQIASALHVIVQISRMRDGHRRIMSVTEVVGMEGEMITLQELYKYEVKGDREDGTIEGEFKWTGIMPRFLRRIAYYGEYDHLAEALQVKLPKLG